MKTKKLYYHYCVDVFSNDNEDGVYKLWYVAIFRSKSDYKYWLDGFHAGIAGSHCITKRLSKPYIRYYSVKLYELPKVTY